ncbi:MAG: hypothetical protein ACRDSP_07095 [Pseudonocardiaceae bacterium]
MLTTHSIIPVSRGLSHLRRGVNGIKHIPAFDGMMMQAGSNLVVVTTRFAAELEDGTTNYPHYLPEQAVEIAHYTRVLPLTPPHEDVVGATVEQVASLV